MAVSTRFDPTTMIILLTGPTGVGKTDTSWAIVGQSERMVFLDCDWFASYTPFSWERDADVEAVYEAISVLIGLHHRRDARHFVVSLTIEMAFSFARHRHHFDRHGLPLQPFRLRCNDTVLLQRIAQRDRPDFQKHAELEGAVQAQRAFDQLCAGFRLLDTSALDSPAAASLILASRWEGEKRAHATEATPCDRNERAQAGSVLPAN